MNDDLFNHIIHTLAPMTSYQAGFTPEGRPAYLNDDGSLSTERTIGVSHPLINQGQETNIPTVYDGRELNFLDAIRQIIMYGLSQSGEAFDPVTRRRLYPQTDPMARSRNIHVIPFNEGTLLTSQPAGSYYSDAERR